jgi:hypothetical protein
VGEDDEEKETKMKKELKELETLAINSAMKRSVLPTLTIRSRNEERSETKSQSMVHSSTLMIGAEIQVSIAATLL